MFRKLNEEEKKTLLSLRSRRRGNRKLTSLPTNLRVQYLQDGNLTFAFLRTNRMEIYLGWAKFNPNDEIFVSDAGQKRAFWRAVQARKVSMLETRTHLKNKKVKVISEKVETILDSLTNLTSTLKASDNNVFLTEDLLAVSQNK